MTKNKRPLIITLIVLLGAAALLLGGIMIFAMVSNSGGTYISRSNEIIYDESFDGTQIKSLTVNSDCGNINIKPSENGEIRITAQGGNADNFYTDTSNGSITISSRNPDSTVITIFPFSSKKSNATDIDIYLPADCPENVKIISSFGNVQIDNSINTNLTVECACGNITAAALQGSFKIHSDCGNIVISEIDITSDSSLSTDLGNIKVGKTNSVRIDYETSLGNCNVQNNNHKADIVLTAETDLGNITINN